MNAKKAKAIRRAFKAQGAETAYRYNISVKPYEAVDGSHNARYRFSIENTGPKRLYRFGKMMYRKFKVMPNVDIPV